MDSVVIWLVIVIVLGVAEVSTAGLVSIWFCGGALAAMILAALDLPTFVQIAAFFFVSILLLIFTRPITQKYLMRRTVRTNADMIIGQMAVVTETIDNLIPSGLVKVKGQVWTARNIVEEQPIETGEKVLVREIEGVKLIVQKITPAQPSEEDLGAGQKEVLPTEETSSRDEDWAKEAESAGESSELS